MKAGVQTTGCDLTDLSTLHVPPHGSLAADGDASAVQHGQDEDGEGKEDEGDDPQNDGCGPLAGDRDEEREQTSAPDPESKRGRD